MLFRPRVLRRRLRAYQRTVLGILAVVFFLDAWAILSSRGETVRYRGGGSGGSGGSSRGSSGGSGGGKKTTSSSTTTTATTGDAPLGNTSVYIVSVHRNTEGILRDAWVDAIVRLVDDLGHGNVFVSAVESGSQDHTKDQLVRLQALLHARRVPHSVRLGATVWQQLDELNAWPARDAPPQDRRHWIWHAAEDHYALRRIPYLAKVRNQAMQPLLTLAGQQPPAVVGASGHVEKRGDPGPPGAQRQQKQQAQGKQKQAQGKQQTQQTQQKQQTQQTQQKQQLPQSGEGPQHFVKPKQHLFEELGEPRRFDRILWINDVAFDTDDVLTLLNTRDGHYAAACAMDFKSYPQYYDTFALRDEFGDKAVSRHWPWFGSAASRADVCAGRPVRVQSCWNGMVVFEAEPFYRRDGGVSGGGAAEALQFRGIDDSLAELHLEGSECCLIHADNPLTEGDGDGSGSGRSSSSSSSAVAASGNYGVWLNPNVRVAYSVPVYREVRTRLFPGAGAAVWGVWANRWHRAKSRLQFALESQTVKTRLHRWHAETPAGEPPRREPGTACLINEMQIMWQNGWKHL